MNIEMEIKTIINGDPSSRIQMGRDVRSGNFRGWGLEFGILREWVFKDKLFQEALSVAGGRTLVAQPKLCNLFLLIRFWLPFLGSGDIIEFGSYRGGSTIFMAFLADALGLPFHVYGLDTFQGMPMTTQNLDMHSQGDFSDLSFEELICEIEKLNISNLTFVKGLFEHTAEQTLRKSRTILLAHIDCDIYSAVKFAWQTVKPYMAKTGGYIVFDDPLHGSCLGAFQAVEETVIGNDGLFAEQVYLHLVYRYPPL